MDLTSAEQSFKEVVEISESSGPAQEEADGFLHLSRLYRAESPRRRRRLLAIGKGDRSSTAC